MYLFATIAIVTIALLVLAVVIATKTEFRKMDKHPEEFPEQFSHEPEEDSTQR